MILTFSTTQNIILKNIRRATAYGDHRGEYSVEFY